MIAIHLRKENSILGALVISRKLITELDRRGSNVVQTEKTMNKILSCRTVKEDNKLEALEDLEKIWEEESDG